MFVVAIPLLEEGLTLQTQSDGMSSEALDDSIGHLSLISSRALESIERLSAALMAFSDSLVGILL